MVASAQRDWLGHDGTAEDAVRFARFYDLRYDDHSDDIEWCRGLASRTGGPVLELGCGTGRVAVPLAGDGHRVVGLDQSSAMLDRARERARAAKVEATFALGDMRDYSLQETFPLILVLLNTFLMLEPDDRWAFLARAREHLSPGGILVIDVFQPDPERIASADGGVAEEGRFDTGEGSNVTIFSSTQATVDRSVFTWTCDETASDAVVRRYSRTVILNYLYRREAELLLPAAGLEIERIHGDYDGNAADERSPRLIIVAGRRERRTDDRRQR